MRKAIIALFAGLFSWSTPTWAANTFDSTSQIGSARSAFDGDLYTCGLTTKPSNSGTCWYYDGNWHAAATHVVPPAPGVAMYTNSGIYMQGSSAEQVYGYYVAHSNTAPTQDYVCDFYFDHTNVGNVGCQILSNPPQKIGPRLGVTYGHGTTPPYWVFFAENSTNTNGGHLYAMNIATEGTGVVTWTDITNSIATTPLVDNSGGPIAAATSGLEQTNPIVAVRNKAQTGIIVAYFDTASVWNVVSSPTFGGATTIGNSIAISSIPSYPSGTSTYYDWILVTASDGHLYGDELYVDSTGVVNLGATWTDFGTPSGASLDSTTDSLAADWYTDGMGATNLVAYPRVATSNSLYSVNISETGTVGTWTNLTVSGTGNWVAGDTFLGGQSALTGSSQSSQDLFGVCNSNPHQLCALSLTAPASNLSWSFHSP
jgi:hypothetical protein